MAVSLWQDSAQKRLAHNKHEIIRGSLLLKMDVLCKRWECKSYRLIFTRDENLIRHFKEERCTEGEIKIICPGSKFKHILNSPEKVFYGGNTNFCYTICQWIEAHAIETGKHIHLKICGHGGECMVNVWVLNDECKRNTSIVFGRWI